MSTTFETTERASVPCANFVKYVTIKYLYSDYEKRIVHSHRCIFMAILH